MDLCQDTGSSAVEAFLNNVGPDELRTLADKHGAELASLRGPVQRASASALTPIPIPSHKEPLTSKIVQKNCRRFETISPKLPPLVKFSPQLKGKTAVEVIDLLSEKFEKEPNAAKRVLLLTAINQYGSSSTCNTELKEAIEKAKAKFHEDSDSGGTDDIWFNVFADVNYGGGSLFADINYTWSSWGYSYVGDNWNDKVSSLQCGCSSNEVGGYVMLFENADFGGRYLTYALDGTSKNFIAVPFVGRDFNDTTSSILMQRRYANELGPISVGSLVPPSTITNIVNKQSPDVRSRGDPIFSWDLWPNGTRSPVVDPLKQFIYLNVPVSVNTHQWFFGGWYDCEVHYWIYLYIDGNGKLEGYVAWTNCWVQGGLYTNQVLQGLAKQIPSTLGAVNDLISQAVSYANIVNEGDRFNFLYYLPGTDAASGNTNEGVSLVLVK